MADGHKNIGITTTMKLVSQCRTAMVLILDGRKTLQSPIGHERKPHGIPLASLAWATKAKQLACPVKSLANIGVIMVGMLSGYPVGAYADASNGTNRTIMILIRPPDILSKQLLPLLSKP